MATSLLPRYHHPRPRKCRQRRARILQKRRRPLLLRRCLLRIRLRTFRWKTLHRRRKKQRRRQLRRKKRIRWKKTEYKDTQQLDLLAGGKIAHVLPCIALRIRFAFDCIIGREPSTPEEERISFRCKGHVCVVRLMREYKAKRGIYFSNAFCERHPMRLAKQLRSDDAVVRGAVSIVLVLGDPAAQDSRNWSMLPGEQNSRVAHDLIALLSGKAVVIGCLLEVLLAPFAMSVAEAELCFEASATQARCSLCVGCSPCWASGSPS